MAEKETESLSSDSRTVRVSDASISLETETRPGIFTTPSTGEGEQPLCSLIEIDSFSILLDCGWTDDFDVNLLKPLAKIAPRVDLVLVSHSTFAHIGALPYAFSKLGLRAKVLSTIPAFKFGQMFCYEAYLARANYEQFDAISLDEIDAAFDQFTQLKYSQRHIVRTAGASIELTAFAAGHSLGGAIWMIKRESDEIVYAVHYNHKSERHLNPSVLETINKPTLLITDGVNTFYNETSRKQRESHFLDAILSTVSKRGSVLIPTDAGARVLELLIMLDGWWSTHKPDATLVLLSNVSYNIVDFARSQIEWMSDPIMKKFSANRENAFNLKNVKICHNLEDLKKISSPRVVLACNADLSPSYSLDIFLSFAPDPANRVIFTEKSRPKSLARRLLENPFIGTLNLSRYIRIPLEGAELVAYELQRKRELELEAERQKAEEEQRRLKRERIELYDDEAENEAAFSLSHAWQGYDLYSDRLKHTAESMARKSGSPLRDSSLHESVVYLGSSATTNDVSYSSIIPHAMFPSIERRAVFDRYGENIRLEDYKLAAERNERMNESGEADADPMQIAPDVPSVAPTKSVLQRIEVAVNCTIQYIEFEGLSDGRSVKKILAHVQPRNLIISHGTRDAVESLGQYCRELPNPPRRVFTPHNSETIDVTDSTEIFRVPTVFSVILSPHFTAS